MPLIVTPERLGPTAFCPDVAPRLPLPAPAFNYLFRWNRNGRKGQVCAVTARGTMNSCLAIFEDGYSMVTSRNAIKKAEPLPKMTNGAIDSAIPPPG